MQKSAGNSLLSQLNEAREEVAALMRRLYSRGLTTTSGGNVSLRVGDHILVTASQYDKATVSGKQVAVVTLCGDNLTHGLRPSIETDMHLSIYRQRPDVRAVVHAHPPTATAFSATTEHINCRLTAEAYFIIGEPRLLPYACMGSSELAAIVAENMGDAVCALLENHGILTVGESLIEAFDRLEVLEEAAKMTVAARLIGTVHELSADRCSELDALRKCKTGKAE